MIRCIKSLSFPLFMVVLASMVILSIHPAPSYANPPREVRLAYDAATKTLSVTVTHSPFSERHYIEKIVIKKNGDEAATRQFTSQSAETFVYTVTIDAADGDVLSAKATCSLFGSRSETLTVGR